jgi:serine/threonine-protein kinase HipA
MNQGLRVCWWDGTTVGHLVQKGPIFFVYDEAWLRRGLNLSPLSLPFTDLAFNGSRGIDGLPGLIADCLPDAWGRKIARTAFARNKWGEPTTMALLAWRGRRGLGAVHFLPPIAPAESKLEVISAATLARGAAEIERGEPSEVLPQLVRGGTAGGVWPKALVLAYSDGTLKVGAPDEESRPSLLKFDLSARGESARCEFIYAGLAKSAGIRVVETRLIAEDTASERRHLLVTRFDVPEAGPIGQRIHFHSASGLLHKAPDALDYRDLFRLAIQLHVPLEELEELARRMIFNVLASNHDDHGKNHAFMLDEHSGQWTFTPAFDLTYSEGYLQRGTQIAGEVWPRLATMESLCLGAGVKRDAFHAAVENVRAALKQWPDLAEENGISKAKHEEIATRFHRIDKEVCG